MLIKSGTHSSMPQPQGGPYKYGKHVHTFICIYIHVYIYIYIYKDRPQHCFCFVSVQRLDRSCQVSIRTFVQIDFQENENINRNSHSRNPKKQNGNRNTARELQVVRAALQHNSIQPVISTIKQNITQRLQLERSKSKNKTMLQNPVLFLVTVVNNCFNRNEKQNEKQNEKRKRSKKGTKQRSGRSLKSFYRGALEVQNKDTVKYCI